MPRLEGGPKDLDKRMKSKGLQRLRWFCQVCEKQCRDENAFKQHTLSESHVRRLQVVGENSAKFIGQYTRDFQNDFVRLLRTSHGEKPVQVNHFYQSYISDKMHVHLNATRWNSLTEFAKHLGREGICRVTDDEEKGLFIAWIDSSPETLRRQAANQQKDRMEKNDEQREQREIQAQIERAQQIAAAKAETAAAAKEEETATEAGQGQELPEERDMQPFKMPSMGPVEMKSKDAKTKPKQPNVFSAFKKQQKEQAKVKQNPDVGDGEKKRGLPDRQPSLNDRSKKKIKFGAVNLG